MNNRLRTLIITLTLSVVSISLAQVPRSPLGSEFMQNANLRLEGNAISFCIPEDILMTNYHRELVTELAAALLLEARIVDVAPVRPSEPLDYKFSLSEAQIFYLLTNQCDVYVGLVETSALSRWNWLITSRAYIDTRSVFVSLKPDYERLIDIPRSEPIGSRSMTSSDMSLLMHLQELPPDRQWPRFAYFNNLVALESLQRGDVTAALVWEPAILQYQLDNPELDLYQVDPYPVTLDNTSFVMGMRSQDSFIQNALDEAIQALSQAGILDELSEKHAIPRAN